MPITSAGSAFRGYVRAKIAEAQRRLEAEPPSGPNAYGHAQALTQFAGLSAPVAATRAADVALQLAGRFHHPGEARERAFLIGP